MHVRQPDALQEEQTMTCLHVPSAGHEPPDGSDDEGRSCCSLDRPSNSRASHLNLRVASVCSTSRPRRNGRYCFAGWGILAEL